MTPEQEYRRRYYENNKEKVKAINSRWNKANPEKMREARIRHYKKHPERAQARRQKWYENNKEHVKEYNARYNKAHPEKPRAYRRKRLSEQALTIVDLTKEQEREILSTGCLFCHTHHDLVVAHDKPISKGGNTTRGNLFCLCRACNSSMKKKTLKDMLEQTQLPL